MNGFQKALCVASLLLVGCGGGDDADGTQSPPPQFLFTGFIAHTSGGLGNTAATFDFTQAEAAGRRTVAIRNWQRAGTLGWQSNQQFTADYQANDRQVSFTGPGGFSDSWTFLEVRADGLIFRDSAGATRQVFNCTAVWPDLIKASTPACR